MGTINVAAGENFSEKIQLAIYIVQFLGTLINLVTEPL